ncbi:hypothetical protein Cgig2_023088 [Carnegiea gigantea]|uniref:Trichome birefringence-like N-terminal domain-containing protein n=1 Tax=Carnegiea gigantea TaxID=171969 RepID=A0A9Q1GQM1_9CARY|nr:hypothetical protein Cgig2_023088 [Carnegiea gigantea]
MGKVAVYALIALASVLVVVRGRRETAKPKREIQSIRKCDLYAGRWVYDSSYPLYNAADCPFIEHQFDCRKNGRSDSDYLKFRWEPSECRLPRFNGVDFLSSLRGKKVMFVGDSISLNQWQSLACILHTSTPDATYTLTRAGGLSDFTFPAYNASLMFLRDGFLIKIETEKIGRVLELNSVSQGQSWKGIDILVFNTWHWWLHTGRKQPWDFIEDGKEMHKDMDRLVAYEKGLRTWARWVDIHLGNTTTKVYFQGVSPDHMNSLRWPNSNARSTCIGEKEPVQGASTNAGLGGQHPAERVVEKVVGEMSRPVHLLRVTRLSQMRKDGHPGMYGLGGHRVPDCSHWCLPGVPDTWNHLLYASLMSS